MDFPDHDKGEKTPLLTSNPKKNPQAPVRTQAAQQCLAKLLSISLAISFLTFVCILLYAWPYQSSPSRAPPYRPEKPLIPFPTCPGSKHIITHIDKFLNPRRLLINESITDPNVRSKIHLARGAETQDADIIVETQIGSQSIHNYNPLQLTRTENGLLIASDENQDRDDPLRHPACTQVAIIAYINPRIERMNLLEITTVASSIELAHGVKLETDQLMLSSSEKDIAWADAPDCVTGQYAAIHNLQVSTRNGTIFGNWALDASMKMNSHSGNIKIDLIPYNWSYGPYTAGNINVKSTSGNIDIRTPFLLETPSQRKYMTSIRSNTGDITGEIVHGSETNITTKAGSIEMVMLPYNVYPDHRSQIRTKSGGRTTLRILVPIKDSYWSSHVMNRTLSRHETGDGNFWVQYPAEWLGNLRGKTDNGTISLRGSFDDKKDISNSNHTEAISARKGQGGSDLRFKVGSGNAELIIGTSFG
ncbi:hypothetical protein BT63DRAFT_126211 [Microthyrium microscopicum]|uniref:Adhesin domain-containing protein n=1 Tax=Microthyrium microscopicum TaxID=703497 RepID=A0A6A6TVB6_9PEZI|nr:hypothetical protein BT63DRAFT_126211 [Microthyrium microscopicum]